MAKGRQRLCSDEVLAELAERYSHENTADLGREFGLKPMYIRNLATEHGWRKIGKVMRQEEDTEIVEQMRSLGAQQRTIFSGVLWALPGNTVHLSK